MMPLEISYKRVLRGPCLKLSFSIKKKTGDLLQTEIGQGQFSIDNLVDIRLQFQQNVPTSRDSNMAALPERETDDDYALPVNVSISTKKSEFGKDLTVKLKVTCVTTNFSEQFVCTDNWTDWVPMGTSDCTYQDTVYIIDDLQVNFTVTKAGNTNFANLYNDTDIVDFKLSLDDGSVPVHKACLAAHSSKFKSMLTSVWKDKEGRIDVEGVTKQTLQYLKDYMYLGKLPDFDLRPMLLFAVKYSMENLKNDCITKLVETVEFHDLYNLLEFACKNNIPELTFALMVQTPDETVHNAYELKKNLPKQDNDASDEKKCSKGFK